MSATLPLHLPARPRRAWPSLLALLLAFFAMACGPLKVTYFDTTTYKNLTDLKPEVMALYDGFTAKELDAPKVAAVKLRLAQAAEYEKGKGTANDKTADQFAILQRMFARHVQDRAEHGPWSEDAKQGAEQNIGDAFDIAIASENLKNKQAEGSR